MHPQTAILALSTALVALTSAVPSAIQSTGDISQSFTEGQTEASDTLGENHRPP